MKKEERDAVSTLEGLLASIEQVALYARRNDLATVDDILTEVLADLLARHQNDVTWAEHKSGWCANGSLLIH